MKSKMLVLILVLSSLLMAGCIGDNGEEPEVENETPVDVPVDENISEDDVPVDDNGEVIEPQVYTIRLGRLDRYTAVPNYLEINRGDTVYWRNEMKERKLIFTVISEDGLWEEQRISYGMQFNYTFTEAGTYNFTVPPWQSMNSTVIVK
ncbi:hypothetical protein [Methanococcoides sp. NM1]|uniref:hypothetical protein n=1 Tax=Methanococcoides sp. NM1 TaxID=1201013 RepID=UPI0010841DDA|nr:hypothetical protein [Methanococcoides sp. NM1]